VEQNQPNSSVYTLCVAVGNDEVKPAEVELSTSALNQFGLQPAMDCLGVQMVWAPTLDAEAWSTPDLAENICRRLGVRGTRHEHECTTDFTTGGMSASVAVLRAAHVMEIQFKLAHDRSDCFTSLAKYIQNVQQPLHCKQIVPQPSEKNKKTKKTLH
jgi:hypothetical protein